MNEIKKQQLHSNFAYQNYLIGKEKIPMLVVDNFLSDPEALVQYCVDTNSFNTTDNFYPGQRMPAPEFYIRAIHHYLGNLIDSVFGLKKSEWQGGRSVYSIVVTHPSDMKAQQCIPHVDSFKSNDLACIHYLCDSTKGGTSLYRHKKTGYEIINNERIASFNQVAVEEGVLEVIPKSYMNGSNDFFEQIACVDSLFNRIVIYPTNVLHSGNIAPDFNFDPNPKTGRLTLNSFIYSKTV